MIGTSDQSCWLAEACKCYLGHQNNRNREKKQIVLAEQAGYHMPVPVATTEACKIPVWGVSGDRKLTAG